MVSAEDATPLSIRPLVKCCRGQPDVGRYEILQSLVSELPRQHSATTTTNDDENANANANANVDTVAEIETALEVFIGPDDVPLWKRVVVRSGPICPEPVIHASFPLPGERDEGSTVSLSSLSSPVGNALCWTAFPEQPDHLLLCVLASPTLLCIWDVYPGTSTANHSNANSRSRSLVGEGHSTPLPFEASSILALMSEGTGGPSGLLIQRVETIDDHLDAQQQHYNNGELEDDDDDDDDFVLKAPPRPVRTSMDSFQHPNTTSTVPSLFSLSHPLDDVLPIAERKESTSTYPPGMITDVFEKVLFVGTLSGVDPKEDYLDRQEFCYPICVTYHTHKKR